MTRGPHLVKFGVAVTAALFLAAVARPVFLPPVQGGLWEVSGAPAAKAPLRICLGDMIMLARFEHRDKSCSATVLKSTGSLTAIDYQCPGAGFGHSEVDMLTPRSLRISTQGISDGLPFNYVLQAHRIGDCPKVDDAARH